MTKKEIFEELLSKYKIYTRDLILECSYCDFDEELDKLEKEVENYKERFEKAES